MLETDFKRLFKESVKLHKGFAAALSSNVYAGLPDMYVVMPGYIPMLVEAKYLKDVPEKFSRTIKYSPMQKHILEQCNLVCPGSAFGLIGFRLNKRLHACLIPHHYTKIDYNFETYCAVSVVDKTVKHFDVPKMLDQVRQVKYDGGLDHLSAA